MLGVQLKAMFCKLGLSILARTAKFTIHRRFHDDLGSALIWGHRKLEVHIAVRGIDTSFLEKCGRHMEHLKLSPGSWSGGIDEGILRPTENGINPNLLRSNAGNRDVLRQMAEI